MLPNDQYEVILRGSYGFLWLGTQRGLIRYDGENIRWYRYDPQNEGSLSSNDIQVLFEDRQRQLWVGTGQGLNLLDRRTGRVQRVNSHREPLGTGFGEPIWAITDSESGLWIGTESGLFHWESTKNQAAQKISGPKRVSALAVDAMGKLWIGSDGYGLHVKPPGKPIRALESCSAKQILAMVVHPDGELWVGSDKGLFMIGTQNPYPAILKPLPSLKDTESSNFWVTNLTLDSKKRVWAGTNAGIYRVGPSNITHYSHNPEVRDSLSGNRISDLYCDHQDLLWISTQVHGLDLLNLNQEMMSHHPMEGNEVQTIHKASDGSLWVGTKPEGLALFAPESSQCTWPLTGETIRQIHETRQGALFVATDSGLFNRRTPSSPFQKVWGEKRVWRILQHGQGRIFLGTDKGLYEYLEPHRIVQVLTADDEPTRSLANAIVTALENDGESGIWIGTFGGGLYHYQLNTNAVRQFGVDKGPGHLTASDVVDLFIDRQGRVWVATLSGGINIWDPQTNTMSALNSKTGFPTDAVVCILQDRRGVMWANTGIGTIAFREDGSEKRIYTIREGNNSGAAVPGSGYYDASQDVLYFGGSKGLLTFQPETLPPPLKLAIAFTSFSTREGELHHMVLPGETLDLASEQAPFFLHYTVLNFIKSEPFKYGYLRNSVDSDWVNTQTKTPVSLPDNFSFGGLQELRVRAQSENSDILTAKVLLNIAPPVWYRWLPAVIGAVLLAFGFSLYLMISAYERRKRTKLEEKANLAEARSLVAEEQARLADEREHMEREKRVRQETHALVLQEHLDQVSTEIASSLHDGPLSQLQGLRFKLRDLATRENSTEQELLAITDSLLPQINRHLRHICGRMLKPQLNQGLIPEIMGLCHSLQSIHPQWNLETDFDPQAESLDKAHQIKLIRIFRTLLHNVSKYAQATLVSCSLKIQASQARLEVADNGKGFQVPPRLSVLREKKHFGLYMVNYFSTSMAGQCHIDSSPERGTRVTVHFPVLLKQRMGL